jgi:hypothetical protein
MYPAASISADGGFLTWQDNSVMTNGLRIRAARLSSSLTTVSNFVVSAAAKVKTTGDQEKPQTALLHNGGAVFVWQGGKVGAQQIYARFLGSNGLFIGRTDIRVSTHTRNNQSNPQVATLADGSVMIVWSSYGQDGSMLGVFARHFSATGSAIGSEFQVNQFTLNNQRNPSVAALADGGFLIAWISELQSHAASVNTYVRVFSSSGVPMTDEFVVDDATNRICANPVVAGSPQGGFMVAWSQNDNPVAPATPIPPWNNNNGLQMPSSSLPSTTTRSTNSWDVFGRLYDANNAPLTDPFRLNSYTLGDQYGPRLAAAGTNYMAVWTSLGQDGSWEGVFGQFILGNGSLDSTNDFQVNTTWISRQIQPSVASDGVGRFLVIWSSFGAGTSFDLFAQQYQ